MPRKAGRMVQTISLRPEEYEIYANWPRGKRSSKVGIAIRLYDHLRLQKRQRDKEIVELESRIRHQQKVIEDQAKRLDAVLCGLPDPGVGWK